MPSTAATTQSAGSSSFVFRSLKPPTVVKPAPTRSFPWMLFVASCARRERGDATARASPSAHHGSIAKGLCGRQLKQTGGIGALQRRRGARTIARHRQ